MRYADIACTKVFAKTTHLHAVWNAVITLSQEFAPLRLVADRPFFITRAGELYDGPFANMALSTPTTVGDRYSLFEELVLIARLLEEEQLSPEMLGQLEKWSEGLEPILEQVRENAACSKAAFLRGCNALN